MHTARLLTVSCSIPCILGSAQPPLRQRMQTPPGGRPLDADPTRCRPTHWSYDLWCMLGSQPPLSPLPTPGRNNTRLPQTSFASGKNTKQSPTHGPKSVYCISTNLPPNRTLFHLGVSGAPTRSRNPWTDAFNAEYRVSWNKPNLHVTMPRPLQPWVQGVQKQAKPSC